MAKVSFLHGLAIEDLALSAAVALVTAVVQVWSLIQELLYIINPAKKKKKKKGCDDKFYVIYILL